MNTQKSHLQQQFPLSPKKFIKKMITRIPGAIAVGIIFSVITIPIIFGLTAGMTEASVILYLILPIVLSFALGVALVLVVYGIYVRFYIDRYYYDLEEHFITIKKGVFAPAEIHVQWKKIQDVYVDQDIIDRILGIYDVHIASATVTSGIEAHIDGVDFYAAEGLKKILLAKILGGNHDNQPTITEVPKEKTSTVEFNEEISSKQYPLTGRWLVVSVISRVFGSVAAISFLSVLALLKLNQLSDAGDPTSILLLVGLIVLTTIVQVVALFIWKTNYAFSFNKNDIYFKDGILSISEKHMPYSTIQDVSMQQGILDRIVGVANVKIENAASQTIQYGRGGAQTIFTGVMIVGISVEDAKKITALVKSSILGRNTEKHGL